MTGGGTGGVVVNQCPNGGVLDCTAPLTLGDGVVTDFSAMEWSATLGHSTATPAAFAAARSVSSATRRPPTGE